MTALLYVCMCYPSASQNINVTSSASLAEKIYLQLDSKVYTLDRTIWFKSVVINAWNHAPSKLSGVLYVELIGPDERIVEQKLIKLKEGIGDGFFELNQGYVEGVYQIRAYTEWNKNFGADFIFAEYIQLFSASSKTKTDPIGKISLLKGEKNYRRINATINPLAIDSLHKKDVTLIVATENQKDTLLIKKNEENKYVADYAIPEKCQFITLQILTKNQFTYTKTIALDEDRLDLQFFPESGELVNGIKSKVGFKALDYNGKGTMVEGEIVDKDGVLIVPFKSNYLGMGYFTLKSVDSNVKYFARLSSKSEKGLSLLYPLPAVASRGNVLSVSGNRDEIRIKTSSSYLRDDSVCLRISCRGVIFCDIKGRLKEGTLLFLLHAKLVPEGILAFTMMDNSSKPLAERLYFNERPESRINIALSADKESYAQREMTRLDIETKNSEGAPVKANVSILVLNRKQMGPMQSSRQNILSSFLLCADLKGEVEDPGFYFSTNQSRSNDLDALLLTQGWRKYLYTRPVDQMQYQPEPNLPVSGTVSGLFSRKNRKISEITMMTFGKNRSIQKQKTDSLGRFKFNIDDEYGQNLNILIQSANNRGEKKNYTIAMDKKIAPPIAFNHVKSIGKVDSLVETIVAKNIERKKVDDSFKLSAGNILLGEVEVEAYKMTPERKKVIEEYGKPDEVISGKAIQDKEEKWSYGLYSVLLFNFPDKVIIKRGRDGNLYAKVTNSEMTLVVIDGQPVLYYDYGSIPNIPPSEVKSFEIIEGAKNFMQLYLKAFPLANPAYAPAWGDVIAIYTYAGNGIYGARSATGIVKTAVPVFAAPREFYAEKHENIEPTDWYKPDLRALVHWEPKLQTDSTGKTSATFYNADNLGEMMVVVEAISDTGELGYREFFYPVKKNNLNKEGR